MRKLRIFEHISLDGIIQANDTDGGFPYGDWTASYRSPAGFAMVLEMYGENFDLLLGRKTYDMWSVYWPKAQGPMADRLNAATKYIVTHRPESLEWGAAVGLSSNLVDDVRELKATSDRDLILAGSSTLTSQLIEHGLVDEIILLVSPVLLGQGKRFFAEGTPARTFAFESTASTPTGVLINRYKFVGPLTGVFL